MEKREKFISGLPEEEVDGEKLQDALQNMLKQTANEGAPALGMFAQLQKRRATRLDVAAKGLSKELGKDHPDVVMIQDTAKTVGQLNSRLDTQSARMKTWRKARPNEWVVFGTVVNAENKPVSGLVVRLYDRDRKYDDFLGESETDANGDFSIIYHERDFMESGENLPELYVTISDSKGKEVYSSRDNVRFNSGRSEYFAIRLGKAGRTAATKSTAAKSTATTTKVSRKKG
jgi:hypothetical protein